MDTWHWLSIGLFLILTFGTVVVIGQSTANDDMAKEMKNAILYVSLINFAMIVLLGGMAYFYLRTNMLAERAYIITILHLGLLLSIVSVSVTSLQKI
ncbi:MAG: hypothetical protein EBU66_07975 [Bacteroidetes bacterium]|jgi:cell division protein FtsW (lipid II flippase)|nr:hypothetical protein [bacterium]NBP64585.1 hypothetical protein [Bacteroidota bacterium]